MLEETDGLAPRRPRRALLLIWSAGAILAVSIALLAGCERSRPATATHACLIVGLGEDDPLWPILKASAQSYVGTARSLQLKMVAPPKSDPAAQADLARKSLDRTVTAICLQSDGSDTTRDLAKDLTQRGTAVILIGRDIPETGRFGYVGWDEFDAGKMLATALKASLRERTTFMLLHAGQAGATYTARLSGFAIGMQDYTFLRELHRYDCQADPAQALRVLTEQSQRYPQLGAWACIGDWPAHVPLEDLRRSLGTGTTLALVGALPNVWPLLEQGVCPAAVGTDYGRWGYEAVSLSELAFHRSVKPGEGRRTEPRVIRADELDRFKQEWTAWGQGRIDANRATATPH